MNVRTCLKSLICLLIAAFAVACAEATETMDEPLDPANSSFAVDGKSDSLNGLTDEEVVKILEIVNSYSVEELDAFLNVRAARNIVSYRDRHGAFEEIRQLFQVNRVGPYALEALRREAQTFEGIEEVTDPREMVEIREVEGERETFLQVVFHGQLSKDIREQPGLENGLSCNEATGSCKLRYLFHELNDYTDRAEPGHIAVSFRSDEARRTTFPGFARGLVRFSDNDGPFQCVEVASSGCVPSIYGQTCTTPIRCSVRLPEEGAQTETRTSRTEPVIASELARIDSTDSGLRVVVMGELADSLNDQAGVSGHLECDDAVSECALRARFERVNDYIDRAQAGHIVASFRTDETDSESFRRLAANLERYGSGPMECTRVSSDCVSTPYSSCSSQYRCGIRLPE